MGRKLLEAALGDLHEGGSPRIAHWLFTYTSMYRKFPSAVQEEKAMQAVPTQPIDAS
uniref:Uncharacterized protein n=1 Tax=Plectus sambesii TaxID=2011161 RepID=A0A914WAY3_9BILA